jgi:hypothetical protein
VIQIEREEQKRKREKQREGKSYHIPLRYNSTITSRDFFAAISFASESIVYIKFCRPRLRALCFVLRFSLFEKSEMRNETDEGADLPFDVVDDVIVNEVPQYFIVHSE